MLSLFFVFFFFNDTATTEIYTLSLHDALPIFCCRLFQLLQSRSGQRAQQTGNRWWRVNGYRLLSDHNVSLHFRSEEHTSELQSQSNLVCRLLLEKKKKNIISSTNTQDAQSQRF